MARKVPKSKFADQKSSELAFTNGRVHKKDEPSSTGVRYEELLKQGNLHGVSAVGSQLDADSISAQRIRTFG